MDKSQSWRRSWRADANSILKEGKDDLDCLHRHHNTLVQQFEDHKADVNVHVVTHVHSLTSPGPSTEDFRMRTIKNDPPEKLPRPKKHQDAGLWSMGNARVDGKTEGKYLVLRRDGTIPHHPHFVFLARDPAAPVALRAYAEKTRELGNTSAQYVEDVLSLADVFSTYRVLHGTGDPGARPHRTDDPDVIRAMQTPGGRVVSMAVDTKRHE